jgi:hypothetical protein
MFATLRKFYPWILLTPILIFILIPGAEQFRGNNIVEAFGNWAWDRHHNMLSWMVRPLMILPFIYFSYRRSWSGIVVSLIAIITNFFWFPMPAQVDPSATEFLNVEREYMESAWNLTKVLLTLSVPVGLAAMSYTFWKRSLLMGLLIIDGIFLLKSVFSVELDASGWALIPFLIIALAVFNVVILLAVRFVRNHRPGHETNIASHTRVA